MGKWKTALRIGSACVDNRVTRTVGGAILHPQRTMAGLGTATKTLVVGGGLGYLAWENLVNDKPVVRTVSDVLIGEETTDKAIETASSVADKVGDVASSTVETLSGVKESASTVGNAWSGIGDCLSNITSGNGLGMMGNFFSNLFSGNVSGMSMLGLVASAFLIFGRWGWLGKIGGLLMAMMMIGNNSRKVAPAVSTKEGIDKSTPAMRR